MEKRIELNCHTHFSRGTSIVSPEKFLEIIKEKDLSGIAITDNNDINAWYESYISMQEDIENSFKLIYGITLCVVDNIKVSSDDADSFYLTVLVQNEKGRKNLFELLSLGVTKYTKQDSSDNIVCLSDLIEHRNGLIIGWSCDNSYLSSDYDEEEEAWHKSRIENIHDKIDYYEVAPASYNPHYPFEDEGSYDITDWIIQYADKINKPVVAVSAAKYPDRDDIEMWKILQYNTYSCGKVYMGQNTEAYLRSTKDMMRSFAYLGEEKAKEIVIDNPRKIAESIELDKPFDIKWNAPYMEDDRRRLSDICYEKAHELYGAQLSSVVGERIEAELSVLAELNCETIIMKMRELVENTGIINEPHNLRGSLDNSFIAFLCGISTVNPLKPHYLCDKCHYSDFDTDELKVKIGYSLPDKVCPICGKSLGRDGFNLPFEYIFGTDDGKIPDFSLNVRPLRQSEVQDAISSLDGIKTSFKGSICHIIGYKKAVKMIEKYCVYNNINLGDDDYEAYMDNISDLSACFTGYGLHPGRLYLFPERAGDISNFFPLYKQDSGDIISGVEYTQIDNMFYGMSILALNQHELLYRLENDTNCPLTDISFTGDSVFDALPKGENGKFLLNGISGLDNELADTIIRAVMTSKDKIDFLDLMQINGMLYGTGVWLENGEMLMEKGYDFADLISTIEDCFDYFIQHGIEHRTAFEMVEDIRKDKEILDDWKAKWKDELEEHGIPEWYNDSCAKIQYLFPRAHCASYAKIYWQLIYYKAHYPEIFYQTYIDVHGSQSDKKIISGGEEMIKAAFDKMGNGTEYETMICGKDTKVLETALEMYERGFSYKSEID